MKDRKRLYYFNPLNAQNGQTYSNNSSAVALSVLDHFVGLALKGLIQTQ